MAHLDLKIALHDAHQAAALKKHFEDQGAACLFEGQEKDDIFYLDGTSFLKQRHSFGVGDAMWDYDSASDEFVGFKGRSALTPVNKRLQIYYKKSFNTPAPHYIIDLKEDSQRGINTDIFGADAMYAHVEKKRSIYGLALRSDTQGVQQTNLRLHFDEIMLDKPYYFLEIEAKFPNRYRKEDIVQAQKNLNDIQKSLGVEDDKISSLSYGKMVRDFKMQGLALTNDWLEDVPETYLSDIATSQRKEFGQNAYLMHQGAYNDGAYVLLDGKADVHHEKNIFSFGHGAVLGELATMNRSYRRCADVIATEKTTALHLSKELVFYLDSCPRVAAAWTRRYLPSPIRA